MRRFARIATASPTLLAPFLLLLSAPLTAANPFPRDDIRDHGYGYLQIRDCDHYCGADNQICCSAGQQCQTNAGIADCTGGAGGGDWDFFTTTWTETRTYTSTISSQLPGVTAAPGGSGEPCVPEEGTGQIACGPICCANWQYCADKVKGQCMANEGASYTHWTTIGVITTQFSAPYRVTSGSTIYETSTGEAGSATAEPTETEPATAPVEGTDGGLSGGAIAGIVIGTIAGVALLLLCCFCCIARGLWGVFASLFGGGKKKNRDKERIEVIEERYSRHGSAHGGRPQHTSWFGGGGGGGRPSGAGSRKEKKSGGGGSGMGWLAASAGAMALLLGLKRDKRNKAGGRSSSKPPRSDWSSSYYTASYTASSPSEFSRPSRPPGRDRGAPPRLILTKTFSHTGSYSSDRRTRDTRRSRQSRATRASRPSRR